VLVNNAVASTVDQHDAAVADLTTAAWEASLRVNLSAPMWLARAAIPHMIQAGHGAIVNVSTRQAERASKGYTAYIASKAGLNGLTRAIAVDYALDGIRCNCVSPGDMETPMILKYFEATDDPAATRAEMEAAYPGKRIAHPREVAQADHDRSHEERAEADAGAGVRRTRDEQADELTLAIRHRATRLLGG